DQPPVFSNRPRASARCNNYSGILSQNSVQHLCLKLAKTILAVLLNYFSRTPAFTAADGFIQIDHGITEQASNLLSQSCLATAHESHDDDLLIRHDSLLAITIL